MTGGSRGNQTVETVSSANEDTTMVHVSPLLMENQFHQFSNHDEEEDAHILVASSLPSIVRLFPSLVRRALVLGF